MSDHNTGHHAGHSDDGDGNEAHGVNQPSHGPGHEMDVPPTKELFNIVWGLGALTLLSLVTCVQLFNNQQRDIIAERGNESSQILMQYRKDMEVATRTAGESTIKDSGGAEIKQRYVPLTAARDIVLSKPDAMKAAAPPKGWMHPDDIAAGAQAGGTPAGGAVQAPPDAGSAPGAGPAAVAPGDAGSGGQPTQGSGNPPTPETPTGTLHPTQGGPVVPSRPGTDAPDAAHSEPGVPVADPKATGKTGTGTGPNNVPGTGPSAPGTVDGKPTGGAVAPATGAGTAGKAPAATPTPAGSKPAGDEGKSPAPTPAH
jgi:hypothetical protein